MAEQSSPFPGAGMGELPDRRVEMIDSLVEHLVAMGPLPQDGGVEVDVYVAELQRRYEADFYRLDILRPGDGLTISESGVIMSVAEAGNFGMEPLGRGVFARAEVVRPIVMDAPLIESMGLDSESPELVGRHLLSQISASVQITNLVIGVAESGIDVVEEPIDEDGTFMCAPLIYPDMVVQRQR